MSAKAKGVITGSVVLTLVIGTLNSIYKYHRLPGMRFYFGSGVMYLFLVFFGQFEEEIAKNLAIAVAVFTVLGEGGGLVDGFLGKGTSKTTLDTQPNSNSAKHPRGAPSGGHPQGVSQGRRDTGKNAASAAPGLFPTKPLLTF